MKALILAVSAVGVMSSFTGSAIADVSINIRFGASPSYDSSHNFYRTNIQQPIYPSVPYYQNNHDRYNRNINSSVIVREVYPSSSYNSNSWNYTVPQTIIQRSIWSDRRYNSYHGNQNSNQNFNQSGNHYIIKQRIIRVR